MRLESRAWPKDDSRMTFHMTKCNQLFTSCTLRPMKGMSEKKIAALPSYVTAHVSSATRVVRRVDVARVILTASQP